MPLFLCCDCLTWTIGERWKGKGKAKGPSGVKKQWGKVKGRNCLLLGSVETENSLDYLETSVCTDVKWDARSGSYDSKKPYVVAHRQPVLLARNRRLRFWWLLQFLQFGRLMHKYLGPLLLLLSHTDCNLVRNIHSLRIDFYPLFGEGLEASPAEENRLINSV